MLPPISEAKLDGRSTRSVYFSTLGNYGKTYFTDDRLEKPLEDFQANLKVVESKIATRNQSLKESQIPPYEYLLPSKIPQSINI